MSDLRIPTPIPTPTNERVFDGHNGLVTALALSPDQSLLAGASDGSEISIWNTSTGKLIETLDGDGTRMIPGSLTWSLDGTRLYIAYKDGNIFCHTRYLLGQKDRWSKQMIKEVQHHIDVFAMRSDGLMVFAGANDFYEMREKTPVYSEMTSSFRFPGTALITKMAFSDDGTKLAVGFDNGEILLWDVPVVGQIKYRHNLVRTHEHIINYLFWNGDGLISASADGVIKVSEKTFTAETVNKYDPIHSLILGGDDLLILETCDKQNSKVLIILQLPELNVVGQIHSFLNYVFAMCVFGSDHRRLITGCNRLPFGRARTNAIAVLDFGSANFGRDFESQIFNKLPV